MTSLIASDAIIALQNYMLHLMYATCLDATYVERWLLSWILVVTA